MNLQLFRHTWGTTGSWEDLFPNFQTAGYHGIETGVPQPEDRGRLLELLAQHDFDLIAQIYTEGRDVDEHLASFERQLMAACELKPLLVNSHSGRDAWSEAQSTRFFERALAIEAAAGIPVAHETHRQRVLYNPWVCSRLLEQFAALQLCCDYSHWVCVCERLLDGELEILAQCAPRCRHLHARVGHEQGPQVGDPRAPEYARHLAAHEAWWRMIWNCQQARGDHASTLTPEFGPPPYAPTLPFTATPVSDVAEICDWMARRQAQEFESLPPI